MAGLLESLSMGLRSAGGIMDEGVYKGQRQEELIQQQLQEKRKDLMLQQTIKGLESGAIPKEVGDQIFSQLGVKGLSVGPDAATQERQARARLEEGYRSGMDQLAPDAPLEDQARLAARFGKPEIAAQLHTAVENRKLREYQITADVQSRREKLAQDLAIAAQRGEDANKIEQMRIDAKRDITEMVVSGRKDLAGMMASNRQPPAPTITEIEDPNDPTKGIKIDARTRQVIGRSPPKTAAERSLPKGAIDSLAEAGAAANDFSRLTTGFQDSFGGKTVGIVGDAQNLAGRNVAGSSYGPQAQWWQDYQNNKNVMRHKLFGSALTVTEKAEFEKSQINPGMTPQQITTNLARQKAAADTAARKLAGAYTKGNYGRDQVEAALGVPLDSIAPPPSSGASGAGSNVRQQADAILGRK